MNVELKPCPFCGGEAEMMGDQYPYVECHECGAGFTANHSYNADEDDAASNWNSRRFGQDKMKRIAEKKIEQLGGDVCGVLVRKDGRLAAVDEHGRVQWLQSGQGSEPLAKDIVMQALDNLLYDNYELSYAGYQNRKSDADLILSFLGTHSRPAKQGVMLECAHCGGTGDVSGEYPGVMCPACGGTCKAYPQPAQQGRVPHWKELEALADEYVEGYEFRGDEGDYQPNDRERFLIEDCVAGLMDEVHQMMKRTAPQPTAPLPATPRADGWIRCEDRLPTEDDGYVWIYYPSSGVSTMIWQWDDNIGEDSETHWMPTGLKRPQPPKEGKGDE